MPRSAGALLSTVRTSQHRHQTLPCQTLTCLFIKKRCTYRSSIRQQGRIISVSATLIHSVEHGECKHTPLYSWTDWIAAAIYQETQQWRMEMFSSSAACHCHGNDATWKWIRRTRSKHNSHSVQAMDAVNMRDGHCGVRQWPDYGIERREMGSSSRSERGTNSF